VTALLHELVDLCAMWSEDVRERPAIAFRPAEGAPLDCFGPLPALELRPPDEGRWVAPSPRPMPGDGSMEVWARPAVAPRRGTAVLVPPWKVPGLRTMSGYARLLARAGLDTWTLVPPRHLGRAPPGVRSGEGFVSPNLPEVRAALEQLVLEIRALAALAGRRGGEVVLVGLSLGALAAGLAATGPERIDRVALLAPPADVAAVFAETRIGRRYLRLAERAGAPMAEPSVLEEMLAPIRPDRRPRPAGKVMIAAGSHDRIALHRGALQLADAWGIEPQSYAAGHLTLLFLSGALRRDLEQFLLEPLVPAPAPSP
jgi:pimeloyl-ACP methyl ester carboxylesterase